MTFGGKKKSKQLFTAHNGHSLSFWGAVHFFELFMQGHTCCFVICFGVCYGSFCLFRIWLLVDISGRFLVEKEVC
jgi:hypothetical protein